MPKNIVICSDGTGNTANKNRGTNVFKIFEAIDLRSEKFPAPEDSSQTIDRQVAIYDDGVGSQSFIVFKILGGAFGWGLKRNIKQLYIELARVYEPGDRLYFFGFSRGAFTVRTLVGFIARCGIPITTPQMQQKTLMRLVDDAYKHHQLNYRSKLSEWCFPDWINKWLPRGFNAILPRPLALRIPCGDDYEKKNYHPTPSIRFIGVWDTVSAVGLPFKAATEFWNHWIYRFSFKDHNLCEKVEKACQALSIDDERQTFHPELWNEDPAAYPNKTKEDWNREWIEQVWFPGVHSNVGGGYPKQGMSLVTLRWMIARAHRAGLKFIQHDLETIHEHANITDKLYKSRAGLAAYYRYLPRNILALCHQINAADKKGKTYRVRIDTIKIHESLQERICLGTEGYAPGNLPPRFLLVQNESGVNDNYNYSEKIFGGSDPEKETGLWEKIQPYINLRRQAYYLLLFTSLTGLGHYVDLLLKEAASALKKSGISDPGCWRIMSQAWENASIGGLLASFCDYYLWVFLGLAFLGSWATRVKMENIRTAFWQPFRK